MKLLLRVALLLLLILVMFGVVVVDANTKPPVQTYGTETWTGNGSEWNCDEGGTYHWILTAGGGKDFEVLTATLYVEYKDGSSTTTSGYRPGNGSGAMHFDVTGGEVESAYATYTWVGTPGNLVLTISHSTCNTTTTSTTSTTLPPTTTTQSSTTTTQSSTTTTQSTTTTTDQVTTTTVPETTTTTEIVTTTTVPQTTTTEQVTTTTVPETTTTVPSSTTTTEPSTTTTVIVTTTTTDIPSGGGTTTTTVPLATTTTDTITRSEYPFTGASPWIFAFVVIGLAAVSIGYLLWRSEK